MATAEHSFAFDTQAWTAARRRRLVERVAPWGILVGIVLGLLLVLAGGSAAVDALRNRAPAVEPKAQVPPPPRAETPIAVWNGLGADGVAAEAARQLMLDQYPITAVGDAPDHSYERTYVMYQVDDPAGRPAARELIRRLQLKDAVPTPLEGVGADRLGGARLLLIVADPLPH